MKNTKKLVTFGLGLMIGSCILQFPVHAESYQDNVTMSIMAERERAKGVESLQKSKEEVFDTISYDMDINEPCRLSKEDFVDLLNNMKYDYNGVFARNAETIWELEQEYRVNALFVCGIAAYESLWCSSGPATATNNFTSQMTSSGLIYYETEEKCFRATFENLANNYLDEDGLYYNGKNIISVNTFYCPGRYDWSSNVALCMKMFFD